MAETGRHLALDAVLDALGAGVGAHRPAQSVLAEAGPGLATALWRADRVDRLYAFIAPKLVGGGRPVVADLGVEQMAEARRFAESRWELVGPDILFRGYVRAV
jgi:diaminohydroxyphosphoribosylaminopyrimidine deaminase/5-amino-6-(5-phosphoribosylamino)uracil reductase